MKEYNAHRTISVNAWQTGKMNIIRAGKIRKGLKHNEILLKAGIVR
jgi:hypothetical protein